MITKFCVVRYLPHPLSGEMMNIGIIAWGEGKIATHFMKDWRRIRTFGHEDISFLQDFVGEVSSIYLPGLPHRQRRSRTRLTAARLALNSVSQVLLQERGPLSEGLIKKQHSIRGKFDEHQFDVVVANGRPFFAAQGLSFERSFSRAIQKDVDATAWAIDDVRKIQRTLPVAVLASPPADSSKYFDRARKTFQGLKAEMVLEDRMDAWVKRALKTVPAA